MPFCVGSSRLAEKSSEKRFLSFSVARGFEGEASLETEGESTKLSTKPTPSPGAAGWTGAHSAMLYYEWSVIFCERDPV